MYREELLVVTLIRYASRFRRAYEEMNALAAHERWSRIEIERHQLERLNAVWNHAIVAVPHYRRLRAARRLPPQFSSLTEFQSLVPVLSKDVVRSDPRQLLSEKAAPGGWRKTAGSTGEPLKAYWGQESYLETLRAKYRFYQMWNIDIFDRMVYLWGHSNSFLPGFRGRVHRVRQPLEDRLRNRLRLSAYSVAHADLRRYLGQIARFGPVSLYGFTSALYLLAREAAATRFQCASLKLVTLTGESAFDYMVQTIESAFSVPAVLEYGSSECGVFANEWPDRKLHVREDVAFVETQARDDGRYDILVSVLTNPSFPLLRYAIGDVTDRPLTFAATGFATLSSVVGRSNDFVINQNGERMHYAHFEHLLKHSPLNIRRFQLRQHADGALFVVLETGGGHLPADITTLRRTLEEWMGGFPVHVTATSQLKASAAGKHQWLISELCKIDLNGNVTVRRARTNTPAA